MENPSSKAPTCSVKHYSRPSRKSVSASTTFWQAKRNSLTNRLNPSNAKLVLGITLVRVLLQLGGVWHWNGDIGQFPRAYGCLYCDPNNAPYGLLWYAVSYPLLSNYILLTSLIDGLLMLTISRQRIFTVYIFCSGWIWLQAPYDLPILWLSLPGLVFWPLTFLAVIGKLPDNSTVFHYIQNRPYSVNDFQYYALTGLVILVVAVSSLNRWLRPKIELSNS